MLVGIIDSGIDTSHPDLSSMVDVNLSKTFLDYAGVEYGATHDQYGHGTHVAGIIAAIRNNNMGIAGICDNVKLVSLRVGRSDGKADLTAVIDAIQYADENNIKILNISYGFLRHEILQYYDNGEELIESLSDAISGYDGLIVCSAGNSNSNDDSNPIYPASFEHDNILVVGASSLTNNTEGIWSSSSLVASNYGTHSVDIFAPGENILSCFPQNKCATGQCGSGHHANGYHILSGTSMATPIVTGVAALILGKYRQLSPAYLKELILLHCDTDPVFSNKCVSGGRLNANLAFQDHQYHYSFTLGSGQHNCVCGICGFSTTEFHTWEVISITPPRYRCTVCGYLTSNISALRVEEVALSDE